MATFPLGSRAPVLVLKRNQGARCGRVITIDATSRFNGLQQQYTGFMDHSVFCPSFSTQIQLVYILPHSLKCDKTSPTCDQPEIPATLFNKRLTKKIIIKLLSLISRRVSHYDRQTEGLPKKKKKEITTLSELYLATVSVH